MYYDISRTILKMYATDPFFIVSKWMTYFDIHISPQEFFTKPSESQLGCSVSAMMHTFTHAGQKQCIHLNRL